MALPSSIQTPFLLLCTLAPVWFHLKEPTTTSLCWRIIRECSSIKTKCCGTSLVLQGLRICLPVQWAWVRSLLRALGSHVQLKPISPHPQLESSPWHYNEDPEQKKKKKSNVLVFRSTTSELYCMSFLPCKTLMKLIYKFMFKLFVNIKIYCKHMFEFHIIRHVNI